jgi:hypothetical protein
MANFFFIAMIGAMLAVAASLFIGLFYMTREGRENREKSLKMMKVRVYLQGLALLLFALAFWASR